MICVYQRVFVCFGVKFISVLSFHSEVKGRAIAAIEPSESSAACVCVSVRGWVCGGEGHKWCARRVFVLWNLQLKDAEWMETRIDRSGGKWSHKYSWNVSFLLLVAQASSPFFCGVYAEKNLCEYGAEVEQKIWGVVYLEGGGGGRLWLWVANRLIRNR